LEKKNIGNLNWYLTSSQLDKFDIVCILLFLRK
jgi:hypothetical protein